MSGFDNEVLYAIGERIEPSTAQAITLMQKTGDDVSIINSIGNPNGVASANPSSLYHDRSNGNLWLKQSGVGNTGWVLLSTNTQDLHVAKFIVNAAGTVGTGANYTTLTAAMANASSGETIFVMPGTYTENVTLKPGVSISAFDCDAYNGNVTINGTLTMTGAGTCSISGIRLQTNSAPFLTVSGAAASIVNLVGCYLNCSNNAGISFTSASSSAKIQVFNCFGGFGSNAQTLFVSTSPGTLAFHYTIVGSSTTASTMSAGDLVVYTCELNFPITTTGTCAAAFYLSLFNLAATTVFTLGGSGGHTMDNSTIASGTASAISVGSSLILISSTISSSNANAITGAGSISYSGLTFQGSSSTINTSTQTALVTYLGSLKIKTPISLSAPVPLMRDSVTGEVGVGPVSGFTWTDVTGATQTLAVQNGYLTDRGAGVTYTLPATASIGDTIKIVGKLGLATITPNANQQILIGSASGAVGVTGTAVSNNVGDCIELICTTSGASTVWRSDSVIGTWTLN